MCVAVQSYLDQSVSGPELCVISSGAGVHGAHNLAPLRLVTVQVESVALLAFHHVAQARDKLVWWLRRRLQQRSGKKQISNKDCNQNYRKELSVSRKSKTGVLMEI